MTHTLRPRKHFSRTWWFSTCAVALAVGGSMLSGCDDKRGGKATAAAATDWASVTAAGSTEAMGSLCLLCRHIDLTSKGNAAPVTLTFTPKGIEIPGGASVAISAPLWKGMVKMSTTSQGPAAARALPGKAHDYADGLGAARRHAYTVASPDADTLVFTMVKPLEDDSAG